LVVDKLPEKMATFSDLVREVDGINKNWTSCLLTA
jgi:hypothetical protein